MSIQQLPGSLLEKIVNYVDSPAREMALVSKSFYAAVCHTKSFKLWISDFEDVRK
jgi:hypothetical protein